MRLMSPPPATGRFAAHPPGMSTQMRVPAGDPHGGQFATTARAESGTVLERPGPAPRDRSTEHAELADLGAGAGKLALFAPIEAKSVLGTLTDEDKTDRAAVRARLDAYLHWRDLADSGRVHELRARRILDEATRQYDAARAGFKDAQDAVATGAPDAERQEEESQLDLSAAVRRYDAARADVRYLAEPKYREAEQPVFGVVVLGQADQLAAIERFTDPAYRGQVY